MERKREQSTIGTIPFPHWRVLLRGTICSVQVIMDGTGERECGVRGRRVWGRGCGGEEVEGGV